MSFGWYFTVLNWKLLYENHWTNSPMRNEFLNVTNNNIIIVFTICLRAAVIMAVSLLLEKKNWPETKKNIKNIINNSIQTKTNTWKINRLILPVSNIFLNVSNNDKIIVVLSSSKALVLADVSLLLGKKKKKKKQKQKQWQQKNKSLFYFDKIKMVQILYIDESNW